MTVFFNEFPDLLEKYAVLNDFFIISGDINIHTETNDSASRKLSELLMKIVKIGLIVQ